MERKRIGLNWIDRTIGYFSPEALVKRARSRMASDLIIGHARSYEGASKGKRTNGWRTSGSSANTEISVAGKILRDRCRDLVRNNPHAARAIQVIASNAVGTGIVPSFTVAGKEIDDRSPVSTAWAKWAETPLIDADGNLDLYGIQNLAMRTVAESGEVFLRRRRRSSEDKLPVPLQIQVLEPDFLDTSITRDIAGGAFIKQGIEFDSRGKRLAYHFFKEHPGEISSYSRKGYDTVRVPAEDIIHLFRIDRAGQIRGVPWGAPVIIKMRDFDDFQDASLLKQKIAACYVAFVTDGGAGESSLLSDAGKNNGPLPEKVGPGMIELLGQGQTVTFGDPPPAQDYEPFSRVTLRSVAIGYGITYESMTGDLSNVNFSSGRMGWLEFQRNIDQWRWLMMIPQCLTPLFGWFKEGCVLQGLEGAADLEANWTPPARQMIDPVSETNAIIKQIRGGIISYPEAIRQTGHEPKKVLKEIADNNKTLDDLNLILDTDPRKMTLNGIGQSAESKDTSEIPNDAKNTQGDV